MLVRVIPMLSVNLFFFLSSGCWVITLNADRG